jgi:membrane protein
MSFWKKGWSIIRETFEDFISNRTLKLSAALAYYTIFSLPGLMIILLWLGDLLYGRKAMEGSIYTGIADFVGSPAALQVQQIITQTSFENESGWVKIAGIASLVIGAGSVFAEIQDSINLIWRIKPKLAKGKGILKFLFNRVLSFSMIAGLSFLLLVSLAINSLIEIFMGHLMHAFPAMKIFIAYSINILFTFSVTSLLFGTIFSVLPDAHIRWKYVSVGAVTTAFIFVLSRFLISYFLSHSSMSSAYGAAGSVIILLLWVYYSAILLYLGAAFTRVYALSIGAPIRPKSYAVYVEEVEREIESVPTADTKINTDQARSN